jgi:predicted aminopeptidase
MASARARSRTVPLATALLTPALVVTGLLGLLASTASCSRVAYIAEQAGGQLRIFSQRQRIDAMLRRKTPPLSPRERQRLRLVLLARAYASDTIGLTRTAAYTRYYDTGGGPIAHNLSAAPKDQLKPHSWRFPIVGRLPYLGFYKRQRGEIYQRKLQRRGLDTYLRPVSAYSSLGWFADPVYSTMMRASPERLVELVIHESTHTTIFLRGEVGFNESLAVFVGQQGTINFFAQLAGPRSPIVVRARARFSRRKRFGRLVTALRRKLRTLYTTPDLPRAAKLSRREQVFAWAKRRYRSLFAPHERGSFERRRLNNAVVLSLGRYLAGVDFHARVYSCVGRDLGALVALYKQAQHHDDPIIWAARACRLRRPPPQRL